MQLLQNFKHWLSTFNRPSQGTVSIPTEYPDGVLFVVGIANEDPFRVSSNFARSYAPQVAAAASAGLITTWTPDGFTRQWRPTAAGLRLIHKEHP